MATLVKDLLHLQGNGLPQGTAPNLLVNCPGIKEEL